MKDFKTVFKFSMLIVGAIVGAGLASGQEIVVFFAQYGFVSVFFVVPIFFLFYFGIKQFLGNGRVFYAVDFNKSKVFKVYDLFSIIIFVAIGSAMISGGNSLLNEYAHAFSFPVWGLALALISAIVVFFGIKGLTNLSVYLVPVMIFGIVFVCVKGVCVSEISAPALSTDGLSVLMLAFSSVSYCCCNVTTANQVLFQSGKTLSKKQVKWVSIVSSLFLTLLIGTIIIAILLSNNAILFAELPLAYLAFTAGKGVGIFFCVILFLSILTTLFASHFSLVQILETKVPRLKRKKFLSSLISFLLIFVVSFLGFENIISYFYPVLGAIGFVMIFQLNTISSSKARLNCANNEIHSSRKQT